jgi:hypothetical protein
MKLFLITFHEYGYDEYDAFVVAAHDVPEAEKLIRRAHPKDVINWKRGYTVEPIETTEPRIILGSFNAG